MKYLCFHHLYSSVALGHRNKILRGRSAVQQSPLAGVKSEPSGTPEEFMCPITQEIMKDPVIASGQVMIK